METDARAADAADSVGRAGARVAARRAVGQACPRHPGTPGRSIRGVSRYGLRCVALSPPMSVRMSVRPSEEDNRVIVTPSSDGPTVVWRRHRINNPTTSVE